MPLIRYGPETCQDLRTSLGLEWLETNGLGGYACSTVAGANTRRCHGLLIAAFPPPARPLLLLSKLEETLAIGAMTWGLSLNIYPNTVHPEGHLLLREFRLGPFPTFTYANENFELRKTILAARGENTSLVRYELLRASGPARLEIRPLIAVRDYDQLTMENSALDPDYREIGNRIVLHPYRGVSPFQLAHNATLVRKEGYWYRSLQFTAETERGRPSGEDLFNPCLLRFEFTVDRPAWLVASVKLCEYREDTVSGLLELEDFRRRNLTFVKRQRPNDQREETLLRGADQFVVRRAGDRVSILAGYPSLADRGRDALISLPGITLVTGRWDEARKILIALAHFSRGGLIPDVFTDAGAEPLYTRADTSLWFIYAADRYLRYTADLETISTDLYPVMKQIVRSYRDGTHAGIRLDSDGMVISGGPVLTVAPPAAPYSRAAAEEPQPAGKHVEVQALWYNALSTATFLAQNLEGSKAAREFSHLARLCKEHFVPSFWNEESGCLFDSITGGKPDASIRPNQILAAGLPDSMLSRKQEQQVVRCVERELLVSCGLRTLSPASPGYSGRSSESLLESDLARCRGSANSWLIGPYASAYLRAFGRNERTRKYIQALLEPFWQHLKTACLGSVSERFDGDSPHAARGCLAHAAALGELLRVYFEIARPKHFE